ncbi:hypothetical protein HID58_094129 [Brassica napus]|uniref:Uncharacterized protein n=1 Tax=Brassica napus TaxID=3708 RepID=A0ABQ7X8I1_BRANA|nr:hypothetical protein HID58_091511 [Brassica napus]KAH0852247.1 hypothetical protein HID58_094129 [Brassica napus]
MIYGFGFDSGKCSAAEGFDSGGPSAISGTMARRSSSRSRPASSVREEERLCIFPGLRRCVVPGQGVIWLWRVALVGFSNVSVLLFSMVCAGGFLYHDSEFMSFNTHMGWCLSSVVGSRWSCQRFKERSSMPLE